MFHVDVPLSSPLIVMISTVVARQARTFVDRKGKKRNTIDTVPNNPQRDKPSSIGLPAVFQGI